MDILICSKLFLPDNEIGAVRPTNFAKYLNEMGHQVTVITGVAESLITGFKPLSDAIKIERVNQSNLALKLISKVEHTVRGRKSQIAKSHAQHPKKEKIIDRLYGKIKSFRFQAYALYLEVDWYLQAKMIVNKNLANSRYDIVLSSFGPLGAHLIGRYIKNIKKANFWIADLRDNMHSEEYAKVINSIFLYFEREMMKKADAITLISNGQRDMLKKAVRDNAFKIRKVFVVHNGYENRIEIKKVKNDSNILKIGYTGALYSGKRDMSLLFAAVGQLINENKIGRSEIEIHYAGNSSSDLLNQAYAYGIQEIIQDHGYITRGQSIKLQNSCDFLVVLSWNTSIEQGILSGKFFEYLQAFKPLIAITNGELENAELTEMVEDLNLGIACEYIRKDIDLIRLKDYLLTQYKNKVAGNGVVYNPNIKEIEAFHYQNISQKLEKICQNLVTHD
ncbi:MAG: hypothetical protein ACMG51_08765 [Ginsengibacter sp.]